jgi:hypothetical protein
MVVSEITLLITKSGAIGLSASLVRKEPNIIFVSDSNEAY